MDYIHKSIIINQRLVSFASIQSGGTVHRTDFESSTFQFIRDWLNGRQEFPMLTSGSTGTPKTVTITREQMRLSARRTINALELKENDSALICLSTRYIAGRMVLVRAFESNMKMIAVEPSSNPFEKLDENLQVDFMAVVPMQLQTLLSSPGYLERLNKMKGILVGGAPVNAKLKEQIQNISCPVYETYGMTETISHLALRLLNTTNRSEYFQTFPGVNIRLDERGCLVIEDEILSRPIISNDLAMLTGPDKFQWLGRIDNVINSGGMKVSPEKIEQEAGRIFSTLNLQRNFFVTGLPHETLGQEVVMVIEGSPLTDEPRETLRQHLLQYLPAYEVPKQIIFLPEFIYTQTRKVDRIKTRGQLSKD